MAQQLCHLIYVSRAARAMEISDLKDILEVARENNASTGITGILLYKEMSFMQVLEGNLFTVNDAYGLIKRDPRHHSVKTLVHEAIDRRDFSDWAMGFHNLDSSERKKESGFLDFFEADYDMDRHNSSDERVIEYLSRFRDKDSSF